MIRIANNPLLNSKTLNTAVALIAFSLYGWLRSSFVGDAFFSCFQWRSSKLTGALFVEDIMKCKFVFG